MIQNPRWLLLLAALLLFGTLSYAPFWNPDEGRYAAASLEMQGGVQNGHANWVVPHLDTIPRLNKPPLIYWLAGGAFKVFGPSEWAGRLGAAVFSVAVLLILWLLGRAMFDEKTGIAGALIWATAAAPAAMARTCNTDMLLAGSTTIVLWGIWLAIEDDLASWRAYLIAGFGMGLSMLAKGPVGIALPLFIGLVYLALTKKWHRINWFGVAGALFIAALMSAPWFFAIEKQKPGFTYHFIVTENLGRFAGGEDFHKKTPFWYYIPVVISGLLPWTAFLGTTFTRFRQAESVKERHAQWFLWLWALTIIAFFSKSSTKLFTYILPSFPALSLLLAHGILQSAKHVRKPTLIILWLTIIGAIIGAAIFLSDEKTLPRVDGLFFTALIAVILLSSAAAVTRFWRQEEMWKVITAQFAGAMALSLCLFAFAGRLTYYEDASAMFRAMAPYMTKESKLIQTTAFQPTAIFYLARPVYFVNFVNTSGLEEKALKASPLFPEIKSGNEHNFQQTDLDLSRFFAESEPVFVMLRWRRNDYQVPPGTYTWARNNDYKIVSNRPRPANFHFDYTAPAKAALDTNPLRGLPPAP